MVIESQLLTGYAYEELSEVSPDHRFLAYTMYDKDNDYFKLSVRNLNSGSLCSKPQTERVSNLAWAKDGQALLYVLTDNNQRPYRWVAVRIYIFLFLSFFFMLYRLPFGFNIKEMTFFLFGSGYTVA